MSKPTPPANPLENIEALAKTYAAAREELAKRVRALEDDINDARRRKLPGIKTALESVAQIHALLAAEVRKDVDKFTKPHPRTVVFHGYKLGLQKGRGKISFVPDATIALIKKALPKLVSVLVKVKESVNKKALGNLTGTQLAEIGCSVTHAGDEVVIKPVTDDLDKLIERILENAADKSKADDDDGEEEES